MEDTARTGLGNERGKGKGRRQQQHGGGYSNIHQTRSSQRIPSKMIRPFAGTTLVDITIDKILVDLFI